MHNILIVIILTYMRFRQITWFDTIYGGTRVQHYYAPTRVAFYLTKHREHRY